MDKSIEKRYVPHSQIHSLNNGSIHYGEDLFLHRKVMLYMTEFVEKQSVEAYTLKIRKTASFKNDGFLHILDTSFEERSVLIVLQFRPGKLLLGELKQPMWTFPYAIKLVADLGVSMLDAMEEQIIGYSIGVENLWLSEDEHLSIINYWEEGETHTQGAIGLCRLLLQLLSGSTEIPGPFEAIHTYLERIHIPMATAEQKVALVTLIKRVCQGQASLSTLIFDLQSFFVAKKANEEAIPFYSAKAIENNSVDPKAVEKEPIRLFKWVGIGGAFSLVLAIFLIWFLWPSPKHNEHVSVPTSTDKPSLNPSPIKTLEPTSKPQSTAKENQEVSVPNLIGLTQADAEKQALSVGLHYDYFLEANQQTKGSVFKQNPDAGTKASKGDNITFWVSKGSP
jgi:eukaryotic-like serine/threonine-protein kinase